MSELESVADRLLDEEVIEVAASAMWLRCYGEQAHEWSPEEREEWMDDAHWALRAALPLLKSRIADERER